MADLRSYPSFGPEKRLAEKVTDELERMILTGQFKEGEKLPSERELAEAFGVSRTVVREAIRILQTRGLLEVRAGIGSIVRLPSANQIVKGLSLLIQAKARGVEVSLKSLHEVRTLLETDIAALAAERATAEDIVEIERVLTELETLTNLPTRFFEVAVGFHRALAVATHNPLLLILFDSTQEMVFAMRQTLAPEPIAPRKALRSFEQILEHVKSRNPDRATAVVERHLSDVWQNIEAAFSRLEIETDSVVIETLTINQD